MPPVESTAGLRRPGIPNCTAATRSQPRSTSRACARSAGYALVSVPDAHLCCGSAGTYSLLQPSLSRRLRDDKLAALEAGQAERIASANIGCIMHLRTGASLSVQHWIELIDEKITNMS